MMEGGGGLEEDGSMEDAMAEQEELESRVSRIHILDIYGIVIFNLECLISVFLLFFTEKAQSEANALTRCKHI